MAKQKKGEENPARGKLLDAWAAPDRAGAPVGVVATSFTFDPAFFEEECLARFLQIESDPVEDGPIYLIEREEKMAQLSCAAVLVDQHHCRGNRSLRWDLLAARLPQGLLHAKVCLLYWSNLARLIISSANVTEDAYRRNLEVFGVLDFHPDSQAPVSCLLETVEFLRQAAESTTVGTTASPALERWNGLLDRVENECQHWGVSDTEARRQAVLVRPVFTGPGRPTVFAQLSRLWPATSPPEVACAVSPFFDPPDSTNAPASELWKLVRKRGYASVQFHVSGEELPGGEGILLHAPESLLHAQPAGRPDTTTEIYRVALPSGRPLHAKGIMLEHPRWGLYLIGSSNFTSAGTGLSTRPNLEANLAYVVDSKRDWQAWELLAQGFPESEPVDLNADVHWMPSPPEDEITAETELLPPSFAEAIYECDEKHRPVLRLTFAGTPPPGWELFSEEGQRRLWGEPEWMALGSPEQCVVRWQEQRPPAGLWVHWAESLAAAWWPVNASCGEVLPPPDELKQLPLEVLINILSSARPLHGVLRAYLSRHRKADDRDAASPIVDPHQRVDTSQFLLQRTRRVSWALSALRRRLERPVATLEYLRWRLRGPVGVTALADALIREARSEEEKAFLIAELVLELGRVRVEPQPGCVSPELHEQEIRNVIADLRQLVPPMDPSVPENLRSYVDTVFETVAK
ncbi:MAG: hypothetical protein D6753_14645 [Planctomycetota bacterium]|nr:MAG: hypothetical protein D6753_14645 [Planctomycetota bacterium]